MTRRINTLLIAFVVLSGLVFVLGIYLLTTKSTPPQLFITACGEVLRNISAHIHFNPDGLLSSLILLVTAMGISLTVMQIIRYVLSHRRLSQNLRKTKKLPKKLLRIIQRQRLQNIPISIVTCNPTAYTIGLLKPRIVVSLSLIQKVSDEELEAVVLHEFYHLKNRHLLWLLISQLVSSLFFFIPLIEYLTQRLKIEFELTADSYVVSIQKTRDHLCGSLALNLQYASGVIPHFATSPIEKRVESLVGNKLSFERIGIKSLAVSISSLALMLGMVFIQPHQVVADINFEPGGVCSVDAGCQTTDCSSHKIQDTHNFTPLVPASFLLSSTY